MNELKNYSGDEKIIWVIGQWKRDMMKTGEDITKMAEGRKISRDDKERRRDDDKDG
jgi:hypothetical protein